MDKEENKLNVINLESIVLNGYFDDIEKTFIKNNKLKNKYVNEFMDEYYRLKELIKESIANGNIGKSIWLISNLISEKYWLYANIKKNKSKIIKEYIFTYWLNYFYGWRWILEDLIEYLYSGKIKNSYK